MVVVTGAKELDLEDADLVELGRWEFWVKGRMKLFMVMRSLMREMKMWDQLGDGGSDYIGTERVK